jgi:hypothetical protein
MKNNNDCIVDLNKVQYAYHYWINQHGDKKKLKPRFSVHGSEHNPKDKHINGTQTLEQFAKERHLTDVWTEITRLQLTANHQLVYSGTKAKSMWKAWGEKIFKKGKK